MFTGCRYLLLFKSLLYVPSLFRTPYISICFGNQDKSKENFHFCEKRQKAKTAVSICFAASPIKAAWALSCAPPSDAPPRELREWHLQAPSPGTMLASQHQASAAVNCMWATAFVSICSKMCPKVTAFLLYTISVDEKFHRNGLFWYSKENLYRYIKRILPVFLNTCYFPSAPWCHCVVLPSLCLSCKNSSLRLWQIHFTPWRKPDKSKDYDMKQNISKSLRLSYLGNIFVRFPYYH